ncbi:hypothetical protein N3K66_008853 [Trichothecium roseum]|uniref:Uncharacterized protein n=1 Tax=Trichothecium roseum TaxID=47278 RepID=A0ACC0URD3_9HYPO|nr:hypothetical protein N3K66_008853 [Trichothecium roseum]
MSEASLSDAATAGSSFSEPIPIRPSGRKGNRKVRTGCITCKIRKVKCDETKPSCLRCVKTGRKCDGYAPIKPRAPPRRAAASASSSSSSAAAAAASAAVGPSFNGTMLSSSSSPSLAVNFRSPDEVRAFDYYRANAGSLVGASGIKGADDFWTGLVTRLCFADDAVRHAVLAMSSLHESVVAGGRSRGTSFAFREYGKAIAAMREYRSSGPAAVPLLVCVVFICIEFMLDYKAAAQLHICQGRQMLARMGQQEEGEGEQGEHAGGFSSSSSMDMVRKELVPVYARLSLASYLFGSRPAPIPAFLIPQGGRVPAMFATLSEARNALHHLVDAGLAMSTEGKPAAYDPRTDPLELQRLKASQQDVLVRLSQWHSAFTVLKTMLPAATDDDDDAAAARDILHMYHSAATIWTSTALDPLERAFDAHTAHFASIVAHASSAVSGLRGQSAFAFETEIVPPLLWAVEKCRHPLLRRAALGILRRKELRGRRENLWRIEETAAVAAKVLELEEEGLGRDTGGGGYRDAGARVSIFAPPILESPYRHLMEFGLGEPSVAAGAESPDARQTPDQPSPSSASSAECPLGEPMPNIDPAHLVPPFGLPEGRRIKNALIGDPEDGGLWLTTFTDPQPGSLEWDVRRIWVEL